MTSHEKKNQDDKKHSVANEVSKSQANGESTFQLVDNRNEAFAHRKLQFMANNSQQASQLRSFQSLVYNSPQSKEMAQLQARVGNHSAQHPSPIQKKENGTGLPDKLKTGMENLSGLSLDDVKVHSNSDKPAQLNAHAYAQGSNIHLGPGQEKHLPHELAHVVQQKEGRVKSTTQMKGKVNVNDDAGLEKEADIMGANALASATYKSSETVDKRVSSSSPKQLKIFIGTSSVPEEEAALSGLGQPSDIEGVLREWINEPNYTFEYDDWTKAILEAQESVELEQPGRGDYSGTIESLAAKLQVSYFSEVTNEQLIAILNGPFEGNWFKAKACLTANSWPSSIGDSNIRPDHGACLDLMTNMVRMRGEVWDKFVKNIQPNIRKEVGVQKAKGRFLSLIKTNNLHEEQSNLGALQNPNNSKGGNFGLKEAVGSESVTSDIDLSAKGENTEIGVAMINKEFRALYGTEPGAFFDINVYSSDWMFGAEKNLTKTALVKTPKSEELVSTGQELTGGNKLKKNNRNEVWSMVKIRRNLSEGEWASYKEQLITGLGDNVVEVGDMNIKFEEVDKEYGDFEKNVKKGVAEIKLAVDYEHTKADSLFDNNHGVDHFEEEAFEMQASNREYEKIILKVKALRLKIQRLKKIAGVESRAEVERLLLEVHDEVARGLTYANEVYATEGAVLHTVYGGQGAAKEKKEREEAGEKVTEVEYVLKDEHYLQSVNENVGDTLHSIKHNKNDPQYAVYRAGKYIARLYEAANRLTQGRASELPGAEALQRIGLEAVEEKGGAAGSDPMAVRDPSSYFSRYNPADLDTLINQAITFGSKAAAMYKTRP